MSKAFREFRSVQAVGEALLPVETAAHELAAAASRALATMVEERHRANLPADFGSDALASCAAGAEHLVAAANCFGNPTLERLSMALSENGARAVVRVIFQLSADDELVALYEATDGSPGNPIADLLEVELERREVEY